MDIVLSLLQNVLEEGFIYGVVAMGVYITYKILDFPDIKLLANAGIPARALTES